MKISDDVHKKMCSTMSGLEEGRRPFWPLWRELADYYLPKRYVWLSSESERRVRNAKNPYILDGTGTDAARTLAAGMMNGITSPSRPWFSIRLVGFDNTEDNEARRWCDEVTRRMLLVMAESNFYNCLAVMYLDLVVFGSASMLIYDDFDSVIRCYNPALGEFYFAQDYRLQVNTFGREFTLKVHQVVAQFGIENCSDTVKNAYNAGGAQLQTDVKIKHLIEPNIGNTSVPKRFPFRESYWEASKSDGTVLSMRGFFEMPGIFPRWELTANDAYGTCPGMDALPDVIQLQFETKKKAQGIDKQVNPPVIADVQFENKPTALMPNGITYVAGVNNVGIKPIYNVAPPLQELTMDIREVQARIKQTFHNDLFLMISQLDTVRSAAEIDARREEKLVLLGSVLERFENEALDPAINRIFQIMARAGLIPEPPESIQDAEIEVQYVSILSTAQRAVAAIPTERWVGLIGNIAAVQPQVLDIPDWDALIRNYGDDIGVPAKNMNSSEQVAVRRQERDAQLQAQQAANQGAVLVDSAKQLSETDVGGGANALQRILGG